MPIHIELHILFYVERYKGDNELYIVVNIKIVNWVTILNEYFGLLMKIGIWFLPDWIKSSSWTEANNTDLYMKMG